MYIENANTATRALRDERVAELNDGKPVVFNDDGTARVKKEVGEYLADEHETIRIADREDSDDADDADDDDTPVVTEAAAAVAEDVDDDEEGGD